MRGTLKLYVQHEESLSVMDKIIKLTYNSFTDLNYGIIWKRISESQKNDHQFRRVFVFGRITNLLRRILLEPVNQP